MTLFVLIAEILNEVYLFVGNNRGAKKIDALGFKTLLLRFPRSPVAVTDRYLSHELTHGAFCRACTTHLPRKEDYLWRHILPREKHVAKRQAIVRVASFISLVFPRVPNDRHTL